MGFWVFGPHGMVSGVNITGLLGKAELMGLNTHIFRFEPVTF